jgi:hypothetical protein
VSLIGTLEQFNLALVLQRIEDHEKTGLFRIRQATRQVDLYFRNGRLLCIDGQHASTPLGERLVQSQIISAHTLQEAIQASGEAFPNETRLVITLMDLGHVERESLRAWAAKEASQVLQELLSWTDGELYFEEEVSPPAGRLLVSLSFATLVSAIPAPTPARSAVSLPEQSSASSPAALSAQVQAISQQETVHTAIASAPTLFETMQSTNEPETQYPSLVPDFPESSLSAIIGGPGSSQPSSLSQVPAQPAQPELDPLMPIPVANPVLPARVDISFLQSDTVLVAADFSAVRGSNLRVQITPDHWRLLTRVDGRKTLQTACNELALMPGMVCQLAGELLAMGLVSVASSQRDDMMSAGREPVAAGVGRSYTAPVAPAGFRADVMPMTDAFPPAVPITGQLETQSQWGNGGNGATFVPGRGWVTGSHPLPQLQYNGASGPLYATNTMYVRGGN